MPPESRPILSGDGWKLVIGFLVLTFGIGLLKAETPAAWTAAASGAIVGGSQGTASENLTILNRLPFMTRPSGWRAVWGIAAEDDAFSGMQIAGTPRNLRSIAGQFGAEYWEDGDVVATVKASPGEYFEDHPTPGDWDVPIEAWTGIPIWGASGAERTASVLGESAPPRTESLSGAVGIEAARFYHHPIPIVGVVWTLNPRFRVEAVFPEPAVVLTFAKHFEVKLAGELVGGGYLARSLLNLTPVEYDAYRVGFAARWTHGPWNFSAAAGDEVEREFDFFRQRRRIHRGDRAYAELGISWAQ